MRFSATYLRSFMLLSVALTVVVFFSGVLQAQEVGGGIGGRPANPREDNSRSESIFIHVIEPGQSISEGIQVVNNTADTKTIRVYAVDSVASSGGAFACEQFVDEKDSVGSWIALESDEVTLDASQSSVVDFSITAPEDIDVGEHDGCIVVEESNVTSQSEQGIGLSFRTAIRVALQVPGDIVKNLEFVDFVSSQKEDSLVLSPFIKNSGNVSIDTSITTRLQYFFGTTISEIGGQFPVLRDQTGEWNFAHEKPFWGGVYKASTSATYDQNEANFIGSETPDEAEISYGSIWVFVVPQPLAAAIELIALILVLVAAKWALNKKKHAKQVKKSWVNHTVASGENIKSIAKNTDVSWKKLAKVNGIKPPYTLEKGSQLKVPRKLTSAATKKKSKIDVVR